MNEGQGLIRYGFATAPGPSNCTRNRGEPRFGADSQLGVAPDGLAEAVQFCVARRGLFASFAQTSMALGASLLAGRETGQEHVEVLHVRLVQVRAAQSFRALVHSPAGLGVADEVRAVGVLEADPARALLLGPDGQSTVRARQCSNYGIFAVSPFSGLLLRCSSCSPAWTCEGSAVFGSTASAPMVMPEAGR